MPKRTIKTIVRLLVPCGLALMATAASAVQEAPILAINIPTIQLTNIVVVNDAGGIKTVDIPWLAQYVTGVYSYAVGIAATLAGVMLVVGGFQYLTAGGDAGRVTKAKERITDAAVGLLLVFGSFVILTTINPELVSNPALRITTVKRVAFTAEERTDYGDTTAPRPDPASPTTTETPPPSGGGATPLCTTIESCRTMCNGTRPTTTPGVMDPSLAITIPTITGLAGNGNKASQAVIDGLTRAAGIAHARGYTISVSSGYRPLAIQIRLVCDRMGDPAREAGIGTAVAWPGGSNHGAGYAV
ncbi:MAG: Type secretion system pilin, partial [Candidatus Parcubacteria bacterium]